MSNTVMSYPSAACKSCGASFALNIRVGVGIASFSATERQCWECAAMLRKIIKRVRLRRDTYDLAVSEYRTRILPVRQWGKSIAVGESDKYIAKCMHDAGFRNVTLTQIGLGY